MVKILRKKLAVGCQLIAVSSLLHALHELHGIDLVFPVTGISQINRARPDVIFVALGAPKQELWIAHHKDKLNAKIFIGVGGTLDFISGKIKRAPKFMRDFGFEWLYRLILQPSRIGRIFRAVIVFPLKVFFTNSR